MAIATNSSLKVYYMRHAHQGFQILREWEEIPKELWPEYVGNIDRFTPLGKAQTAYVPAKLASYAFDAIACSPLWRTRQTILPHLKARGERAEIWPELTEFYIRLEIDQSRIGTAGLPPELPDLLTGGDPVRLQGDEPEWFTLLEKDARVPKLVRGGVEGAADVSFLANRAISRLRERFAGSGQSILLVGHANAGYHFLRMLTGREPPGGIKNIGLWMAEEQPDQSFALRLFNDQPIEELEAATRR